MGKGALGVGLATTAALYGSYSMGKAFVPAVGGTSEKVSQAALRGAQAADLEFEGLQAAPNSVLSPMGAIAVGAVAISALGSTRKSRVGRRATATQEAVVADEATEVATEPPAPPPPFNPAEQVGVTAPLGFFDPLGFAKVGDEAGFRNLRVAELKHGRVAMMASVGLVFQHLAQFRGYEAIPHGIYAPFSSPGTEGMAELVAVSGVLELFLWKEDSSKSVYDVGNYGNPFSPAQWFGIREDNDCVDLKNRELNNGRAAMIATLGIIAAELATGKDSLQQFGFS